MTRHLGQVATRRPSSRWGSSTTDAARMDAPEERGHHVNHRSGYEQDDEQCLLLHVQARLSGSKPPALTASCGAGCGHAEPQDAEGVPRSVGAANLLSMEEPRVRMVLRSSEDGQQTLTIYMNDGGQLELIRLLARLGKSDRHVHLDGILTPEGAADIDEVVAVSRKAGPISHTLRPPRGAS